jgi:hypothetical protein
MIRVIDNFYDDPDKIRAEALASRYQLISNGNYPGRDGLNRMYLTPELETKIQKIFPGDKYKVHCSRFRHALKDDTYMSYVHADSYGRQTGWHILVCLTPDPPYRDGVTLYKSPEGKKYWQTVRQKHDWDFPLWTAWNEVEYKYNRAVIIDYSYFHAPMNRGGFGNSIENSRLLHIIEVINVDSPANKNGIFSERVSMPENHHPDGRKNDDQTFAWSDAETAAYERIEYLEN